MHLPTLYQHNNLPLLTTAVFFIELQYYFHSQFNYSNSLNPTCYWATFIVKELSIIIDILAFI